MSSGIKEVALNSKTWGKSLIHHRKMMKAEYKKSMQRLSFLAEERHIQYRDVYIEDVKKRIEKNKEVVAQQAKQIRDISNASAKKKTLIDMGWDSIKKQMSEEKQIRQSNNKIIFEKTKALQDRARREWLIEMNDKCTTWNKSPEELKYAKYRLLNKKVLERLPRDRNFVLDLNEQPDDNAVFETSSIDGYKGPLRSNTQRLAYLLANNGGKLPTNTNTNTDNINTTTDVESLSIDPSSPEYSEYLEFLKYNKERERRKEQKLRQRDEDNISAIHKSLNSENVLQNNTSGLDVDQLTSEDYSTSETYSEEYDEDEDYDEDDEEEYDDEEEFDDKEEFDNQDFSFLDKK